MQGAEAGYLDACYSFTQRHKFHPPAHKHQFPVHAGQVYKVIARVSSFVSYQMPSHESNYSMYQWFTPTAVQFSSLSDSEISSMVLCANSKP